MEGTTRSQTSPTSSPADYEPSQSLHHSNTPLAAANVTDPMQSLFRCDDYSLSLHPSRKQYGTVYGPMGHVDVDEVGLQALTVAEFSKEVLYFLQLSQSKDIHSDNRKMQHPHGAHEQVNSTTTGSSPIALCYLNRPRGRNAVAKARSKAVFHNDSHGNAKNRMKRQLQVLQQHLREQMDLPNYGTQDSLLEGLSEKHPRYSGIIRALPLVAKCIPDSLKKDLVEKTNSETIKLGIMLMKRWSIWAAS
ncbi:hypothetical protein N7537_010469 [Penicillium hordei]|uniref:Uncharacterized protein n=1 Tax=Penicillium hordei TaxID=40994 RepID=A0AAD6GY39_9EURO|nr:uncharacterized protein N7537_010469 [Penicillium hordei]KAJ5593565.1 hypothetical protein N7537_010469 [Penicillium hordei]